MKKLTLAVATALTVAAPAAFAQDDRYNPNRNGPDTPRAEDRDWRVDNGHDYRSEPYSQRDWRNRSSDYARVLESRPLYAAGNAREECWNTRSNRYEELRASRDSHVGAGTVLGAIAGGIIGHQVGSGRGNSVATAGGALLGGLAGNRIENRNDEPDFDRSRCRVLAQNGAAPVAYDVRYEYNGQQYTTRLDHDPGRRVALGRDIASDGTPMDGGPDASRQYGYSGG